MKGLTPKRDKLILDLSVPGGIKIPPKQEQTSKQAPQDQTPQTPQTEGKRNLAPNQSQGAQDTAQMIASLRTENALLRTENLKLRTENEELKGANPRFKFLEIK